MWKVPKLKRLRGKQKVCCGNELFILIFIPWGLNVLWLHADVLVKFSSIILINCSCVLHKNKLVKQIPTKYQCIFFNKMAPCIHPLKCWILNTEKLRNNKWLHQSNPGMNGNDNFSWQGSSISSGLFVSSVSIPEPTPANISCNVVTFPDFVP